MLWHSSAQGKGLVSNKCCPEWWKWIFIFIFYLFIFLIGKEIFSFWHESHAIVLFHNNNNNNNYYYYYYYSAPNTFINNYTIHVLSYMTLQLPETKKNYLTATTSSHSTHTMSLPRLGSAQSSGRRHHMVCEIRIHGSP